MSIAYWRGYHRHQLASKPRKTTTLHTIRTLNSTYEIDHDNMRFRRVEGVHIPTNNVVRNGLWHQVAAIERVEFVGGFAYLFTWADGRSTLTSLVQGESVDEVTREVVA